MLTHDRRVLLATAVAVTVCFISLSGMVLAQEAAAKSEPLPEAHKIINKYIDAFGGKKALMKAKSMEMVGNLEIKQMGITAPITIQKMAPNLTATKIEIPGMGTMAEGFNGTVAWALNPMMGPQLKDGAELAQTKFQSEFYGDLHEASRYTTMETVEKTEIDGTAAYKVRLVTENGNEMFEFFDVETGLLLAIELKQKTPMGEIQALSKLSDYQEVQGLKFPMAMSQEMGGQVASVIKFTEVRINQVDPSAFELPEQIKALTEE